MRRTKMIIAAWLILSPFMAGADPIVIDRADDADKNGVWDITLMDGSFGELQATLMTQPWWGDDILARLFADTLGIFNGNVGILSNDWGPLFAVSTSIVNDLRVNSGQFCQGICAGDAYTNVSNTKQFTYATASRTTIPEPATFSLLALGIVGITFLRRRRTI